MTIWEKFLPEVFTLRKLLAYLRDYKKESVLGPLFKLFEACIDLIVPIIMATIIDKGITGGDTGLIIRLCFFLVGLAAGGLVFSITAQYFAAKASVGFIKQVKHVLFSHIQTLSFSNTDKLGAGTLITRLTSDMNQIQTGVNLSLRLFLRSPFIVLGSAVTAFVIDIKAGIVFAITIPVLAAIVFAIMLRCIPRYKEVQESLDKVLEKTRENLTGVRVIRAFCREDAEINEFEEKNKHLTELNKRVGRISALMNPVTYTVINLGIAALIYTGAIRVNSGDISQGQLVALYNYMAQILVELIKFANMFLNITRSIACGNRVQSVLELEAGMENGSLKDVAEDDTVVEFKSVFLNYNENASLSDRSENALNDITFKARKGETIGIIGGTGAGKSSLVNLIPRFYDVNTGEVYVFGKNVKEYDLGTLRKKIGFVLQKAVLFKGSIRDNMKWGNEAASDEAILEALSKAQALEIIKGKEGGLDYMIEQGGKNLSGGQKQRFSIARALVKKPEILILDDSSSALDLATDAALRRSIRELSYKPVTFIVSQRTSSIMNADKIIVLDDGEAVGIGKHEELLENCEVYKEIYASQYKTPEKKSKGVI